MDVATVVAASLHLAVLLLPNPKEEAMVTMSEVIVETFRTILDGTVCIIRE